MQYIVKPALDEKISSYLSLPAAGPWLGMTKAITGWIIVSDLS
jgi:hypothetical protein